MVGFQKQNLEFQKNMNSENLRVLRKNWLHWTRPSARFKSVLHSGLNQTDSPTNSKFANRFRSLKSLENRLIFAMEGFGDLHFQKSGSKEYTFLKRGQRKRNWLKNTPLVSAKESSWVMISTLNFLIHYKYGSCIIVLTPLSQVRSS